MDGCKQLLLPLSPQEEAEFDAGEKGEKVSVSFVAETMKAMGYKYRNSITHPRFNPTALLAFAFLILKLIKTYKLTPSHFINIDESGVWFSTTPQRGMSLEGEAPAYVPSPGDRMRITAVLACMWSGVKFPATCIIRSSAQNPSVSRIEFSQTANPHNITTDFTYSLKQDTPILPAHQVATGQFPPTWRTSVDTRPTPSPASQPSRKLGKGQPLAEAPAAEDDKKNEENFFYENITDFPQLTDTMIEFDEDEDYREWFENKGVKEIVAMGNVLVVDVIFPCHILNIVEEQFFEDLRLAGKGLVTTARGRLVKPKNVGELKTIDRRSDVFPVFMGSLKKIVDVVHSETFAKVVHYLESGEVNAPPPQVYSIREIISEAKKLLPGSDALVDTLFKGISTPSELFAEIFALYDSAEVRALLQPGSVSCGVNPTSVYSAQQPNAWITTDIFGAVMEHTIPKQAPEQQAPRFVLMDNCSAHTDTQVMKIIRNKGWRPFYFPAYCTPLLQPVDLCANANFKRNITHLHHSLYNSVLASDTKPDFLLTARRQILNVAYAWNETSTKSVVKGFELMMTNLIGTVHELHDSIKKKT